MSNLLAAGSLKTPHKQKLIICIKLFEGLLALITMSEAHRIIFRRIFMSDLLGLVLGAREPVNIYQ